MTGSGCSSVSAMPQITIKLNSTGSRTFGDSQSLSATVAPAPAWRDRNFDDSGWVGPSRAIFSFGAIGLPVPSNTFLANGPPTFYFRKQFTFSGSTNDVSLRLKYWIDDGAVFYL